MTIIENNRTTFGLQIEPSSKTGFIHFEKYDFRFQWKKPTYIIVLKV